MGREGLYSEIKLGSLNRKETKEIAESMLGGYITEKFARILEEESLGNPLFIVESLRLLSKQAAIIRKNDVLELTVEKIEIPEKVKDVILRRLESLTPLQRRVLDAASVIGNRFDPELLAAVVVKDSLDVLEASKRHRKRQP